jgi:glycosyltransferase involved in cell wall biosynthesis
MSEQATLIAPPLRVLLISVDEFSGVRLPFQSALERCGCEVRYRRLSLRVLGWRRYWHLLRMIVSALLTYRRDAHALINRTAAAFEARSKACKVLVDRNLDVQIVLMLGATNSSMYWGPLPPGIRFAFYTDYMNLITKGLPDPGIELLERSVSAHWNVLEGEFLRTLWHIFVMGAHVRAAIAAAYEVPIEKITVIGAGPAQDVDIERDGYSKRFDNQTLLFVGKRATVKGLGVLLQAFSRVRAEHPGAILHVVANQTVNMQGVICHQAVEPASLRQLYYAASIFVMPAFKEPLGLVFLEAMWSKCACVGTTTGSMPEIIQDGETGLLVPPGDDLALAARLSELLGDPRRTRSMGERGYAAARRYWRWDLVASRMLQVLHGSSPC